MTFWQFGLCPVWSEVLTHPKLAVAVIGVPVVSVALNVGRWCLGVPVEMGRLGLD